MAFFQCTTKPCEFLNVEDTHAWVNENDGLPHAIRTLPAALNFDLAGGHLLCKETLHDNTSLMDITSDLMPNPEDTLDVDMSLLNKEQIIQWFNQLRPISLLPVLGKMDGTAILYKYQEQLACTCDWQFAYRQGYQCTWIPFILIWLAGIFLRYQLPLYIFVSDIPKAYDYTKHSVVCQALESRHIPLAIISWFIRHIRQLRLRPKLRGVTAANPIQMQRGVPQGTSWGPAIFSVTLQSILQPVFLHCQNNEWGANLDGYVLPFIVFF